VDWPVVCPVGSNPTFLTNLIYGKLSRVRPKTPVLHTGNHHRFKSSQKEKNNINTYSMKYEKIYKQLIDKRKLNPIVKGYKERHHILPKSLGGLDTKENIVTLTGREHWVAHLLLHKIYEKPETAHACHMMAMKCEERGIPKIRNSRMYEWARIQCISSWKKHGKKRLGQKNGSYGTMWICNINLEKNKKIKKDDAVPNGWIKGRNRWKSPQKRSYIHKSQKTKICPICEKEFFLDKYKDRQFCSISCSSSRKRKNTKSNKYIINGIEYDGCLKAAKALNITHPTVLNRVKSNKFPNWQKR
jgi:hypothetical protein